MVQRGIAAGVRWRLVATHGPVLLVSDWQILTASAMSSAANLSAEQKAIMHAVVDKGENVFITGSAGTGKSFLVAHLLEMLVAKHALVRWLQRPLRLACSQEV